MPFILIGLFGRVFIVDSDITLDVKRDWKDVEYNIWYRISLEHLVTECFGVVAQR